MRYYQKSMDPCTSFTVRSTRTMPSTGITLYDSNTTYPSNEDLSPTVINSPGGDIRLSKFSLFERSRCNSILSAQDVVPDNVFPKKPLTSARIARIVFLVAGFLLSLWLFLVGLKLMGDSFKALTGCGAGSLFEFVDNPVAGIMVGILCTVLVQSSSTTTSIVVSLVGSGGFSVRQAIPVVMGANIGTTVTSTFVAMGQIADREQFERAFGAATIHDMFNLLSVLVILPLEVVTHMLEKMTEAMVQADGSETSEVWSPVDPITELLTEW